MAATKLRIDLSQGLVEVEGDETFVLKVYEDFKDRVGRAPKGNPDGEHDGAAANAGAAPPATPKKRIKKAASSPSSDGSKPGKKKVRGAYSIVKDLDLSGTKAGRLKDFYAQYTVKTNYERNLIFVYFLQHKMGLTGITEDHIFTCYREVGVKVPKALKQSLSETGVDRGWLVTSNMDDMTVTIHGMNHLEHDMPKAGASA